MGYWSVIKPQSSDVTNLCANPSFELTDDLWGAGGGNAVARDSYQAYRGIYSLGCDYRNDLILASYPITLPTADRIYYLTAYIKRQDLANLGQVSLGIDGFTGATIQTNHYWDFDTDAANTDWFYLETVVTIDSDTAGSITLVSTETPGGAIGVNFWLDEVTITESSAPITPFDGDTSGCYWTGAWQFSTSVAPVGTRNVGEVVNLDDLNVYVVDHSGGGLPPIRHIVDDSIATYGGAIP